VPTEPALDAGPDVDATSVRFRYADPERNLRGVRLYQEVRIPGDRLDFAWHDGAWQLSVERPEVDRIEYLLEITSADGSTQSVADPANPRRVPGAFGDKSVVELPGYRPPRWLDLPVPSGTRRTVSIPARSLDDDLSCTVWSPTGLGDKQPATLLVVHDGPEYDHLSRLTSYLAALVAVGELPPVRAALLPPGHRDSRYSADGAYTRALGLAVLPRLHAAVRTSATVGMGASLGALAILHAQRQYPDAFAGLFLQSGSFFHPSHDAHERRFPHYDRIERSVSTILRSGGHPSPVPTVMTCGTLEENLANNRIMARALAAQGYDVTLHEVPDVHNYTAWRDAFDPCLTELLRQVSR
jgi:enterochelin esterase family protein